MVKISDVARDAGVSVATVSRTLNEHPSVNAELATRVRASVAKLGYRPNGIARSLRRQSTDVLALIISDVENPFFTAITRGVEDVAQKNGFSVLLCNADESSEKEATYLRVAEQEQVAGVLLSPHRAGSDVSRLRLAGIPLVVIDRPLAESVDSVMVDSMAGARTATEHLIAEGWVRPACVTGPDDAETAHLRLLGYQHAVRASGLGYERFAHGAFRQHGGSAATAELLDSDTPPDAFFVANAQMALGVLDELRRRGLVAGRDVGVITFDDAPWAPFISPPMSVIAQPAYEVGANAARLLMDRIRGTAPPEPRAVVLETELVVRDSSKHAH